MDTTNIKTNSKVRKVYTHAKADARQAKKNKEADIRQSKHDALTIAQKLAKAKARVAKGLGNCTREIARLEKQLKDAEWTKAQKVTAAAAAKPAPMTTEQKSVKAVKRSKNAAKHAKGYKPSAESLEVHASFA